jgi:hypothetical protein
VIGSDLDDGSRAMAECRGIPAVTRVDARIGYHLVLVPGGKDSTRRA